MTGSRIAVAVAVGICGFAAPASSVAATGWSYHVASVTGAVALRYADSNGWGADSVKFQGSARGASDALRGRATYTDKTTGGCGPITRTRAMSLRRPSFEVQGTNVVVSWQLPLPNPAYCGGAVASAVTNQLRGRVFSETIPLARFTCLTMSLKLMGSATIPEGGTGGTLIYQITVLIKRPAPTIAVSV